MYSNGKRKFDRLNDVFVTEISNANVLCEYIKNEEEKIQRTNFALYNV